MQMHAFSTKRGGWLYGTRGEDGGVQVHAIYEPPQVGSWKLNQGSRAR